MLLDSASATSTEAMDEEVEMSLSIEYLARHEVGKLLRESYPGRFFCVSCLATLLRGAVGTTYPLPAPVRAAAADEAIG